MLSTFSSRCCSARMMLVLAAAGLAAGSVALAGQPARDTKPAAQPATPATPAQPATKPDKPAKPDKADKGAGQPEMAFTPEQMADMQACMEAGTPGPMHEWMAQVVGTWQGTNKMWMGPDMKEPVECESTVVFSMMMDGRYLKAEWSGEMPGGMGEFNGLAWQAFDNVSEKFQGTWIDNWSTSIMFGTGELSSDQKTLTWNFTYNCPVRKAPATMRQIERRVSKDKITMEMFGSDPRSGKEFKMMEINYTRKPTAASAPTSAR